MKLSGVWNNTNVLFEPAGLGADAMQARRRHQRRMHCGGHSGHAVGVEPTPPSRSRAPPTAPSRAPTWSSRVSHRERPAPTSTRSAPTASCNATGPPSCATTGWRSRFEDSAHDGGPAGQTSAFGVFLRRLPLRHRGEHHRAVERPARRPTSVLLYSRDRTAPPTLTSVTAEPPSGGTSATERASVNSAEAQTTSGSSDQSSISADGRYVAFLSSATNLVAGDTNGQIDIFVARSPGRDHRVGERERRRGPGERRLEHRPGDQWRRALRGIRLRRDQPGWRATRTGSPTSSCATARRKPPSE